MRFSAPLSDFSQLLQRVLPAVPPKSTLPVLENFYFSLSGNALQAVATDQELTIISSLEVEGENDGEVLVPARKLSDVVKALGSHGRITIESDESNNKVLLSTERGEYSMFGLSPDEFPIIPDFDSGKRAAFDGDVLSRAAEKTYFAVSKDEFRPAMTGVFFQFTGEHVNIVSTDSFRLVRVVLHAGEQVELPEGTHDVIVPARAIDLMRKVKERTSMLVSETHVRFDSAGTTIISRLIDERFPAYENVIPKDNDKFVRFFPSEVNAAIKRVALFSSAVSRQVHFNLTQDAWAISGEDVESGSKANETLQCEYRGDAPFDIGFNHRYIEEVLATLLDEKNGEAEMSFSTSVRPALLRQVVEEEVREDVLMLIMPVKPMR